MIRCDALAARYGANTVFSGISFAVQPGEMVGLLGPNGSGKTTLLRLMAGSLSPMTGSVAVDGAPVLSLSPKDRAKRIAFVPQRPESVPDFTVFEMALMGRYPHKKFLENYTAEDHAITLRALEETAALHLADRPARTLSGGELQRAFVARAFAQNSPVLLMDEAATGLDAAHATAVFEHARRRNRATGTTVVAAIHDLNLAALYCSRIIFLRGGGILADGPTRDVFTAENLHRVYDAPFLVLEHPLTGLPQALAIPGGVHA